MPTVRYPHARVGKLAAPLFGVAGALTGFGMGTRFASGPAVAVNAIFVAALGAIVAFLVFSSEGPQRPPSVAQAAAADGVVSGVLIGFISAVIVIISLSGLGTSSSTSPPVVHSILGVLGAVASGAAIGGALGWLLFAVAGTSRLDRAGRSMRSKGKRQASSAKPKRRR